MKKGQQLYVEGRLQTNKYEKDGIERYSTDIIGESFNFVSGSGSGSSNNNQFSEDMNQDKNNDNKQKKSNDDDFEDDIPF